MPKSVTGSNSGRITVKVGEWSLRFTWVSFPIYREVKVGALHKVPMWDFVQAIVVATRVPEIRFGIWELRQVSGTSEGSKNRGSVGENDSDRICTLLEIPGKNKDGIAARLDLLNIGIKIDLQTEYGQRRTRLPLGPWNLSRVEKRAVCNSFYGMKMQQLLPVAIRSVLEKPASGVYLLAHTMQVANAKDKNPIVSNMGFYGVIQEIWDLDYQKFRIPVLRCDWIDNTSGLVVDKLGFTLVDLSKIGHRNDQFVMASQVKQVFYVDDLMHRGWSVVLSMPNREYNDVIGDDVLGDTRIECEPFTRGIPNVDTFDDLVGEFGNENIRDGCEDIWID
ncbi:hypothetical protein L3X38_017811 [Prunus dulcis]|uniref:DUF4216 domain-containing protein n=1 Tax=Prunus dulcis TaxID=3755 RepID=A0AAD4W7U0_PRUDU|nr:hypothetical protein L3X38_017811 [Prunus dulcis]